MDKIMEWLNANSNALMVIITFVYVVATVVICWANISSANASKKQVEESKSQFEKTQALSQDELREQRLQYKETKRLSMMPLLQMSKYSSLVCDMRLSMMDTREESNRSEFQLKNIGFGSAKNISYEFEYAKGNFKGGNALLGASALCPSDIVNIEIEHNNNDTLSIIFTFQDLLDKQYRQTIEIELGNGIKNIINHPIEFVEENKNV